MKKELYHTFAIALPLILGNITQICYALIDTAMIGRIGYYELAAASLVANVVSIPQVMGMGLVMAITPLVAIANGEKNVSKASNLLFNGMIMAIVAGVVLAIIVHFLAYLLPYFGQEEKVVLLSKNYLIIMGYSLLPMMIFLGCKQFADGLEFTKTSMILSLLSLPLNAFLCWLLIYGNLGMPKLGVEGAGWATLISRVALAVSFILVICKHTTFTPFILASKSAWKASTQTIKNLLKIGVPSSLQYFMEAGAFSVSGIMVGWLGAVPQAAHQIALNCASFTFMAALGFSMAGSIRVSNAFGRKDANALLLIGKSTIYTGLAYGIASAVLLVVSGRYLPLLFTQDAKVVAVAASLLVYAALFQISDATQAIGVGLCRGVKDVIKPTIYVAIAYWVIGIPVGYLLAFTYKMGATGIWIGLVVGLTFSSVLLNHRFFTNMHHIHKNLTKKAY